MEDDWTKGYQAYRNGEADNINRLPQWRAGWQAAANAYWHNQKEMREAGWYDWDKDDC